MLNRLLDYISSKNNLDENARKRMKNFSNVRNRMISMIMKKKVISEGRMRAIKNFITFFGCGRIKSGPGTLASFVSILIWFAVTMFFLQIKLPQIYENIFWCVVLVLIFVYSLLLIPIYTYNLEVKDHPSIVIDEVMGQILTLCITFPFVREFYTDKSWFLTKTVMFAHMFLCFIMFRLLDIAKPLFIGYVDQNVKGSFGVMFDDILAGVSAAFINIIFFIFYKNSIMQLHGY